MPPPACIINCGNPTGGKPVAKNSTCNGALEPNTSINGKDDHGDQISNVMAVWGTFPGGVSEEIAYEYQTYGGREYISFLVNFGGSVTLGPIGIGGSNSGFPIFPFNGSVWNAFQSALNAASTAESKLPFPYNALSGSTGTNRNNCQSSGSTN